MEPLPEITPSPRSPSPPTFHPRPSHSYDSHLHRIHQEFLILPYMIAHLSQLIAQNPDAWNESKEFFRREMGVDVLTFWGRECRRVETGLEGLRYCNCLSNDRVDDKGDREEEEGGTWSWVEREITQEQLEEMEEVEGVEWVEGWGIREVREGEWDKGFYE